MKKKRMFLCLLLCIAFFPLQKAESASEAEDIGSLRESGKASSFNKTSYKLNPGEEDMPRLLKPEDEPNILDSPVIDSLYIVGPGDYFQILLESVILHQQVNAEGNITLAKIGIIPVAGLTLKEAKEKILGQIQTSRIKSECFVNLSRLKTMTAYISGAVRNPGTYHVTGNERVSLLIRHAGGFTTWADRGRAIITGMDGKISEFNLSEFFLDGSMQNNPRLKQGDVLFIPQVDFSRPFISIRSEKKTAVMQIPANVTISGMIEMFYLYEEEPDPVYAIMVRKEGDPDRLLSMAEARTQPAPSGAVIDISYKGQDVFIGGEVATPGFIPFQPSYKAIQYISEAGIITTSKIKKRIYVVGSDGQKRDVTIAHDFLRPGDVIYIPGNFQKKAVIYSPIILSVAGMAIAIIGIMQ